jgi:hypothetical protein
MLFTTVSGATANSLKKINDHATNLDSTSKSALSSHLENGLNEQKKFLVGQRMEMWKEAWKNQDSMYVWPEALDATVLKTLNDLPFGGEIKDSNHRSFIRNSDAYLKEFEEFTEEKKHIVQFNGGWQSILRFVSGWDQRAVPESEEIWLAMEDLWVQRELVRVVHDVNQAAAQFKEVSKVSDTHKVFRNRFWEVELKVVTPKDQKGDLLEGTIKNVSGRLQVFGRKNELTLNVYLDEKDEFPFQFVIEGDYLNAGDPPRKVKTLPKHRLTRPAVTLAKVEQVFDSLTVPVWRIDRVALGYASNRTHALAPKKSLFSEAIVTKLQENAQAGSTAAGTGGVSGPGGLGPMGASTDGGGAQSSTAASYDITPAGLLRNRYVTVTNQVRRMQVGLVLILDQEFLPDVLEAFSNSKLRCQNTQYHWKRFRSGRGANPTTGTGTGTGFPNGLGGESDIGSGFPMGSGLGTGGAIRQSTDGLSVSMIELSIYGIASLYEKYTETPPEGETTEKKEEKK